MQLHFYTRFSYLPLLKTSQPVSVWGKATASPSDVHISIDPDFYQIEQIDGDTFTVSRMTWKDDKPLDKSGSRFGTTYTYNDGY